MNADQNPTTLIVTESYAIPVVGDRWSVTGRQLQDSSAGYDTDSCDLAGAYLGLARVSDGFCLITDHRLVVTIYTSGVRRALFLYNPISGRHHDRRLEDVNAAAGVFRSAGIEAIVERTMQAHSAAQQARDAVEHGFDAVIACGGDGTVHQVLQGIVDTPAALGVVPLGTGNALANDLRLPRTPVVAARALVAAEAKSLRLPRIECGNQSRYFLTGAGVGADAHMLYRLTLAAKTRWGMAAYYAEGWRQWFSYPYPLFDVEFRGGGEIRRETVSQLLAIRVEWFGGFLRRLAPGASLHREDLRLVLMKSRRRWSYLRYVTGLQLNRAWVGKDIELAYATELTCRPLPDIAARILAEADGELLASLPVRIAMTDATINLLVPKQVQGFERRA